MIDHRTVVVENFVTWERLRKSPGIEEQGQDLFEPSTGTRYITPARAWSHGG